MAHPPFRRTMATNEGIAVRSRSGVYPNCAERERAAFYLHEDSFLETDLDNGWCAWIAGRRSGRQPPSRHQRQNRRSNKRRRGDTNGPASGAAVRAHRRSLYPDVDGGRAMARLSQRKQPGGIRRPVRPGARRRNILRRPVGGGNEWAESAGRALDRRKCWRRHFSRFSSWRDGERPTGRRTFWYQYSGRTSQSEQFV